MKSIYKVIILSFVLFLYLSSSFAQNYEIIGEFEQRIDPNTVPSIYYDEQNKSLRVSPRFVRNQDFWVDFKKGGKVEEITYQKLGDGYNGKKYKRIGLSSFSEKDSIIYIFKQKNKPNLFYFSYQEELEGDQSWTLDISSLTDVKLREDVIYKVKSLKEGVLAILSFDIKGESSSHLILVDPKTRKIFNFLSIKTQPNFNSLSQVFNDLTSDGKYVVYQEYEHERFEKKATKHLSLYYSDEIGKHIQTFYVQKLGTDQVQKYQIDQSKYYVGKAKNYLLENGELQCVGLYSDLPQTRLLSRHMMRFESTYTNNVKGIFVQSFKDGQKNIDEKIVLNAEIKKKAVTESDGSIALATLVSTPLKKEENEAILMTIESSLYSDNQQRRNRYEKITLCIDKDNTIDWWDLLHIGRGEDITSLELSSANREAQSEARYITFMVNDDEIEIYKATCGDITTKIFTIPSKIDGYKYLSMQRFMNKNNDTYALYTKGKKNILVRLKTGKAFTEILD
ncbi:hypothetical protein [Bernardetia sp. MNP-M8]|uniref:hypothetical protein n=1 Tax=Bernardetia sp. MNP-M8 TaxID=3127470 RepID=UPI0030D211FC